MQITSVNSEPNIPNFQALTWNVGYSRRWPCLHRIEKRAIKRADKYESNLHKYLNIADGIIGLFYLFKLLDNPLKFHTA